jgi:hypothetical protein
MSGEQRELLQRSAERIEQARAPEPRDEHEEARHERDHAPGDALDDVPGRAAIEEQHESCGHGAGREGRHAELEACG